MLGFPLLPGFSCLRGESLGSKLTWQQLLRDISPTPPCTVNLPGTLSLKNRRIGDFLIKQKRRVCCASCNDLLAANLALLT
ncbi:hypothetical protein KOW79_014002 [Hemibagrus wyckioides]|uniref:Uncharacterized protein n=1 Tax=Hemibagrus wyckioides TaxID=337641 RepID=A0A9D3SFR1_9TELE|nr:hypothetical protein KOW79_014002 [Hemibagrus wyckioides]